MGLLAFDADVLIYAADPDHPLGREVAKLFQKGRRRDSVVGVGATALVPEVLLEPARLQDWDAARSLARLLSRLELYDLDRATADFSVDLGARYGLATVDAVHLATAVRADAEVFLTNNRKDFPKSIDEIDVVYPDEL